MRNRKVLLGMLLVIFSCCIGVTNVFAKLQDYNKYDDNGCFLLHPNVAKFDVIYYNVDGEKIDSSTTYWRSPAEPLIDPEVTPLKEGFIFKGWYYDKELTQKAESELDSYFDDKEFKEDSLRCPYLITVELYAKWEEVTSTIEPDKGDPEKPSTGGNESNPSTGDSTNTGLDSSTGDNESTDPIENPNTGAFASYVIISGIVVLVCVLVIINKTKYNNFTKI